MNIYKFETLVSGNSFFTAHESTFKLRKTNTLSEFDFYWEDNIVVNSTITTLKYNNLTDKLHLIFYNWLVILDPVSLEVESLFELFSLYPSDLSLTIEMEEYLVVSNVEESKHKLWIFNIDVID